MKTLWNFSIEKKTCTILITSVSTYTEDPWIYHIHTIIVYHRTYCLKRSDIYKKINRIWELIMAFHQRSKIECLIQWLVNSSCEMMISASEEAQAFKNFANTASISLRISKIYIFLVWKRHTFALYLIPDVSMRILRTSKMKDS